MKFRFCIVLLWRGKKKVMLSEHFLILNIFWKGQWSSGKLCRIARISLSSVMLFLTVQLILPHWILKTSFDWFHFTGKILVEYATGSSRTDFLSPPLKFTCTNILYQPTCLPQPVLHTVHCLSSRACIYTTFFNFSILL